ncbi:MAG TPA: xylulokinase [Solirubrobacteraceae bacterium]|nr:xylulokinase [Solirubrobacteraceae bacterium]
MARLIGLDVGTSSLKGLAIDEHGSLLAQAERAYPFETPRPGWAEQDPELWWQAAQSVLAELDADRADGIGLSGQMHGLVALGEDDRPLRPAILWNDGRSQEQCDWIEATVGLPRLLELSGNRALAGFTAPKLLWMAEHEPELHARIRHVLLPKDYVRLRLTGEHATDVSDASGTLLFAVAQRAWSGELADALAVDQAWLPAALESPALSGRTKSGVPVAAGGGDQAAGALGVGVLGSEGPASVVLGTSGVVFAARERYTTTTDGSLHAFCHAVPGVWHLMGVMLSAAGSLQWLHEVTGAAPFEELVAEAARWEPGVEGLLFAPYLAGERTPYADPLARAAFTGLSLRHDRGALVRAVLEGVAFGLRDCLELFGAPPRSARVSGGGSRGELWLEILAAVLETPLGRTAVDAGAAYGAALLGGVAGGVFASPAEAVEACVRTTSTTNPDAALVARYAELRPSFTALYPALRALRSDAQ